MEKFRHRSTQLGTRHRCDLYVSNAKLSKFQKGFYHTAMKLRDFRLPPRRGSTRIILLGCLKPEEGTETLFRNVGNQFPTDVAQHPRKRMAGMKLFDNLPPVMKHVDPLF
jgi:hypothetical protein